MLSDVIKDTAKEAVASEGAGPAVTSAVEGLVMGSLIAFACEHLGYKASHDPALDIEYSKYKLQVALDQLQRDAGEMMLD